MFEFGGFIVADETIAMVVMAAIAGYALWIVIKGQLFG